MPIWLINSALILSIISEEVISGEVASNCSQRSIKRSVVNDSSIALRASITPSVKPTKVVPLSRKRDLATYKEFWKIPTAGPGYQVEYILDPG